MVSKNDPDRDVIGRVRELFWIGIMRFNDTEKAESWPTNAYPQLAEEGAGRVTILLVASKKYHDEVCS